jgi:hypothetical protein
MKNFWDGFGRNFAHPLGMLAFTVLLSWLMCSWEMGCVVFGVELIMLRRHHGLVYEHQGGLIDHDVVAVVGVFLATIGFCWGMGMQMPAWGIGALLLVCSTQLMSQGFHEAVHGEDDTSCTEPILKIFAGLIPSIALAIGLPFTGLIPMPSWQYWMI